MRGQCGSQAFVPLPCAFNGKASEPESTSFRQLLVDTCGSQYGHGPVCCEKSQLDSLVEQVKRAEPIIASCPACWHNFLQFWCSFTCSPNQSTFVNITSVEEGDTGPMVTSTDYWVGDNFGTQFYDSCKDIKFGSSNGFAMDFIGGGAKNWHEMVSYMGTKRPLLGSPFQIDFPALNQVPHHGIDRYNDDGKMCNDTDPAYRCACIDCQATCPILPPTPSERPDCYVGSMRCWSFSMLMTYSLIVLLAMILLLAKNKWIGQWVQKCLHIDADRAENRGLYERVALDAEHDEETESLLDPDHLSRSYWLNSKLQNWFYCQGLLCARYPWIVIGAGLLMVSLCSLGWSKFAVERDPINLWVASSSTALAQKQHFDSHFSPFYRTTQIFFVNKDSAPIMTGERLEHLFNLETEIKHMKSATNNYTLQDVCFHPNGDLCIVQSVTGYWQSDINNFDPATWDEELDQCAHQPSLCLPEFQQPLKPEMLLGGYSDHQYLDAQTMIVTYVLKNSLDASEAEKAEEWEKTLLKRVLSNLENRPEWEGVRISYSTESSLEVELNKSSNTDALTVVISYVVMFLYASLALGRFTSFQPRRLLVDSKFTLATCGILIVIFSVSTAVGLFSLTGKKITLIIAEVIPFLVLAVGVDNIFILCHEYARREELDEAETVEERVAKTLGRMGPSILLSSLSETIAFGLGTLVTMPAVSSFAIVAAIAIFVDFLLQVTCFVSCMALDARRTQSNRIDCIPCIRIRAPEAIEKEGWLQTVFKVYYAPVILHRKIRYVICLAFLGLFMLALALVPMLPLGLDQRIALPSDSYLVDYFNDLDQYFNIGPPVYFVAHDVNLTDRSVQKKICGRFAGCYEGSLANVLEQERKRPNVSYIGEPTSVWLDDFFQWSNPTIGCCRLKKKSLLQFNKPRSMSMRPLSDLERPYFMKKWELCDSWDDDEDCSDCIPSWDTSMNNFPEGQTFLDFFDLWIDMPPDEDCPLGGKAAYTDAVVVDHDKVTVEASHFRTFHTPLRSQRDFIAAYESARRIADDLSTDLEVPVYPYSVFYVFFEQYTYIITMAIELLGLAILSIFIISSSLLGSLRSGLIVMGVVVMILIDVMGVMTLWGVSLNAVSLVNLVICVGISVEFCCHIVRAFVVASGTLYERATSALVDVGSSVSY
ncbi:patched family-domain-containing protein [Radiomyces spectabilis]|uniref:patched family-domain-containing protein n=1 Tax=Radiomyces spectabilis TaxID=64574 RepID=UPI002221019A|nr:patched family-domain-containing protein [Radiomyces spectabilis]KAI8377569.1 patched family-domain-containing protein [Radiomyces spectabilis]